MDSSPASPSAPRDPSSPESSIGEQIATLQAQLTALQASQPAAAAATPAVTATASKVVFPKHARLDGPKSFTNWLCQLCLALPNQVCGYVLDGVIPPTVRCCSAYASRRPRADLCGLTLALARGAVASWAYNLFDQLYYVSDVVIAKSDEYISTYLFDQLYYVSDVVIAKSDE
ncbi:BQ5605_C020g09055 [Microbotryum silenes-dioicae]|uniref:BQ5605_C020g09055 protein n=1 Tax=Microbotryum silenes-dioicae TaxID=796604 RepID=A0A2X0PJE7_9BASI|nr:BQ5605_C020g09055 [Microbotryum silenes-dioicae]